MKMLLAALGLFLLLSHIERGVSEIQNWWSQLNEYRNAFLIFTNFSALPAFCNDFVEEPGKIDRKGVADEHGHNIFSHRHNLFLSKRGIEPTAAVSRGKRRPHKVTAKWHRVVYRQGRRRQQVSLEALPASDQMTRRVQCVSVRPLPLGVVIDVHAAQPGLAFA
jgi:hypothetical protein